ncbi:hypothetical protein C5167_030541 [Papaver somniferum]|nr:hypothetical protein C5167_030541 [Papaver somniferum]
MEAKPLNGIFWNCKLEYYRLYKEHHWAQNQLLALENQPAAAWNKLEHPVHQQQVISQTKHMV